MFKTFTLPKVPKIKNLGDLSYRILGFSVVSLLLVQTLTMSFSVEAFSNPNSYTNANPSKVNKKIEVNKSYLELTAPDQEPIRVKAKKLLEDRRLAKEKLVLEEKLAKEQKEKQEKEANELAAKKIAKDLQDKAEIERVKLEKEAKEKKDAEIKVTPSPVNISGTKQEWMTAAGIPESDWTYVDFIVNRESTWNPSAVNTSSGACGLAQALPCAKTGCPVYNDPVCALKWQLSYVKNRYGGYKGAYDFWIKNNWY
jgi:Transglycosylase SLT domain